MNDMSSNEQDDWDWLIAGLQAGDEQAVQAFVGQFGKPLENIASGRISPQMAKRFGPQSVALSVCRTFVRRSADGLFELEDGESVWRLLCAITLTKVREKVRFHRRDKRNIDREVQPQANEDSPTSDPFSSESAGLNPAEEVEFADALEHLVSSLDEKQRRLLDLKTQGLDNDEIATEFGCSERSIRRMLATLRERFEAELGMS